VKFYGNVFFFDNNGIFIPENTTITQEIPPQFVMETWVESVMMNAGAQIALSATAVIAINLVIHALLSMGLQQLLGMVETLQIILYMPTI